VLLVLLRVHGEGQVQVAAEGGVDHLRAHAHGGQPLVDGRRRAGTKDKTTFRITIRRTKLQNKSFYKRHYFLTFSVFCTVGPFLIKVEYPSRKTDAKLNYNIFIKFFTFF
jgi:hypothetical protein